MSVDDLKFSKGVPDVRSGGSIPIVEKKESVQQVGTPAIGEAFRSFGNQDNWMAGVGAKVATSASNAIANKLGGDYGQNPKGSLLPPISEFDKTFANSYKAQAASSLGLQANSLITSSNIELSSATRLTPEMIEKNQHQVKIGLQNIYKNAPDEIRPQLEHQYGSLQLTQREQLVDRMLREQKKDRKDNTALVSTKNAEIAHTLSATGDFKGAEAVIKNTAAINNADTEAKISDPLTGKGYIDSTRISALSGRVQYEYEQEQAKGKGAAEAYLANLDKQKPSWISDADYPHVTRNLLGYVANQDALRSQDQTLAMSRFNVSLAQNPNNIPQAQIDELNSHLDPIHQEEAHLNWITAVKKFQRTRADTARTIQNWSSAREFSLAGDKAKNDGFVDLTEKLVSTGISQDDAEVQVVAHAGGKVPAFIRSLQNRLQSADPQTVVSAARQIHTLAEMRAGQAYTGDGGLTKQDIAMYNSIEGILDSQDPNKALDKLHEQIYSADLDTQTANEERFKSNVTQNKPQGVSNDAWALSLTGLKTDDFLTPGEAVLHGNDIFNEYHTNFSISGNDKASRKAIEESVRNNYGTTYINGFKQTTKHPIEQVLNLPHDAVGVVQEDVIRQLQPHFEDSKKRFDKGEANEYWEVTPRSTAEGLLTKKESEQKALPGDFSDKSILKQNIGNQDIGKYTTGAPIEVIRHPRNGKPEKYQVVIVSNPFSIPTGDKDHPIQGGFDIAVNNDKGIRNLYREAPSMGIITYDPDVAFIKSTYLKLHTTSQ